LVKLYSRGDRTVKSVAEELNVNYPTLKNGMKRTPLSKVSGLPTNEKRPQDWSGAERRTALQESHVLSGESLNAGCRERGLLAHHLSGGKAAFCTEAKAVLGGRELRGLKDENEPLKRELLRKDKALSEAAALRILQKKFRALWEDEVK
jgi:transposase-like protein